MSDKIIGVERKEHYNHLIYKSEGIKWSRFVRRNVVSATDTPLSQEESTVEELLNYYERKRKHPK